MICIISLNVAQSEKKVGLEFKIALNKTFLLFSVSGRIEGGSLTAILGARYLYNNETIEKICLSLALYMA